MRRFQKGGIAVSSVWALLCNSVQVVPFKTQRNNSHVLRCKNEPESGLSP
jgi:hypothetical protein